MHKFKKLKVWQRSLEFISQVYKVSSRFPKSEVFGLTDQIRRAAISIALNIAEGSGAGGDKEFVRFLQIGLRSLYEVIAAAEVGLRLRYGEKQEIQKLIEEADEIGAMISGLIKYLKKV